MGQSASPSPSEPLSESEIIEALQRSGYPFEVELLAALDAHGLDPTNGFRLRVADGPIRPLEADDPDEASSITRETDAMARVHVAKNLPLGDGQDVPAMAPVCLALVAVIEAKTLPPNAAFVGFRYKPPSDRRTLRLSFAGAPCNGPLPLYNEAQGVAQQLAAALDPINDAPYCIQWAVAERVEKSGKSELRANHPVRWAAALANMVRGLHLLAVENSRFLLRFDGPPRARVDYYEPTLFIRTPTLYLYDVATMKLTETNRLTLGQMFELFDGQQALRQIDVWTGASVEDFATRYKAVGKNFEDCIPLVGVDLVRIGGEQRRRFLSESVAHRSPQDWQRAPGVGP